MKKLLLKVLKNVGMPEEIHDRISGWISEKFSEKINGIWRIPQETPEKIVEEFIGNPPGEIL